MRDVKLAEYIELVKTKPFEWGVCDCVLFTGDWCEFLTGKNPAEGAHGKYNSEESAKEYLKAAYGDKPELTVDKLFERVEPAFRQLGDIVLCMFAESKIFGVVAANGLVMFKGERSLIATKRAEILIAWRVE
jgi:hypothetical protein